MVISAFSAVPITRMRNYYLTKNWSNYLKTDLISAKTEAKRSTS
jgi:hypothetical protein